jgi:hypothetical protein
VKHIKACSFIKINMTDIFAKKLKFLLLLCVIMTVSASGCVMGPGTGTTGGPGLVIEKFDTTLDLIESGEPVGLQIEVRNQGDYNGEMGIGAPAIVELMSIDPMEWIITPSPLVDLGTILARDIESQTQGGVGRANWELTAPLLQRGQRQPYEIRGRVYYQYETIATRPVWFVTSNELRTIVQGGEALSSDPITQTGGPLSVTINAGPFVKAREWTDARFQLQIRIDNAGGGQVRGRNYPVAIEVTYPQWVMPVEGYCPPETMWGTPIYDDVPPGLLQPAGTFIYMWDGRSTDVSCEFQILQPPASRTQGSFEVKLGYIYSVDSTTQITVKGTEEF